MAAKWFAAGILALACSAAYCQLSTRSGIFVTPPNLRNRRAPKEPGANLPKLEPDGGNANVMGPFNATRFKETILFIDLFTLKNV
jgi:hypothetical protein